MSASSLSQHSPEDMLTTLKPHSRSFDAQSPSLAFLAVILGLFGLCDLVTLSLPDEICIVHHWGVQGPSLSPSLLILPFPPQQPTNIPGLNSTPPPNNLPPPLSLLLLPLPVLPLLLHLAQGLPPVQLRHPRAVRPSLGSPCNTQPGVYPLWMGRRCAEE